MEYLYLIIKEELLLPKISSNFLINLIFKHNYNDCHRIKKRFVRKSIRSLLVSFAKHEQLPPAGTPRRPRGRPRPAAARQVGGNGPVLGQAGESGSIGAIGAQDRAALRATDFGAPDNMESGDRGERVEELRRVQARPSPRHPPHRCRPGPWPL